MISAICKVWCGGCCGDSYKQACVVSPCNVGNYENAEVAVFEWDSDSNNIDVEGFFKFSKSLS